MKILHMTWGVDDVYVAQDDKFKIEWMYDMELIHMFATKGIKAEIKTIDKGSLYGALSTRFDNIWYDKNGVDLNDNFNRLFETAETFFS